MSRTVQWLNSNKYRRYPVIEDLELRYVSGDGDALALPDDLFLDCRCTSYTHAGPLQIASISQRHTGGLAELVLRFHVGTTMTGELAVPENAALPYAATVRTSALTLDLVIGPGLTALLTALSAYAEGTEFIWAGLGTPQFEPATFSDQTRHRVESLLGDAAGSVPISGRVYWEEGYNVALELDVATRSIRVHASPGAGAGRDCGELAGHPNCGGGLFSVNGIYADALGRIGLAGGLGFSIIPEPSSHRITIKTNVGAADIDCGNNG